MHIFCLEKKGVRGDGYLCIGPVVFQSLHRNLFSLYAPENGLHRHRPAIIVAQRVAPLQPQGRGGVELGGYACLAECLQSGSRRERRQDRGT